jgi:hypothetical protein
MNYDATIAALREAAANLLRAAKVLEALQTGSSPYTGVPPGRRGRKSMGDEERQQVSERMKRYWARRRRERAAGGQP